MAIVASLPFSETTVSLTLALLDVENCVSRVPCVKIVVSREPAQFSDPRRWWQGTSSGRNRVSSWLQWFLPIFVVQLEFCRVAERNHTA